MHQISFRDDALDRPTVTGHHEGADSFIPEASSGIGHGGRLCDRRDRFTFGGQDRSNVHRSPFHVVHIARHGPDT